MQAFFRTFFDFFGEDWTLFLVFFGRRGAVFLRLLSLPQRLSIDFRDGFDGFFSGFGVWESVEEI